ncbi:endolytic transglycosylase MltG [Candidatus Microgenomates bacterium]|nr:endolytic transglycosylase MltG [Candidatus Microgenomates bacterium]
MKYFLIIITLLIVFCSLVLFWAWDGLQPLNLQDKAAKTFVVKNGESLKSISQRLEQQKIIKNQLVFTILVRAMGMQNKIQAGEFKLSSAYDASTVARNLTHGTFDVWVTIPEGWRNEEIAEKLAVDLNIPQEEFLKIAKTGYMFPDTYLFSKSATVSSVAQAMEKNFTTQMEKIDRELLIPGKKFNGLTLSEVIIFASIVEREARFAKDRPLVAGILLKRYKAGWPLEVDATLQYALGYNAQQKTWWKNNLTADDLVLDSRYNTRKYQGLPPTPISNPGADVIKAVLSPTETDYWFYLSDKDGQMHYAKTLEGHNENIQKYLN